MAKQWFNFQEEVKRHFQGIGFFAETNKSVPGVRTTHSIDVYAENKYIGQKLKWIVETKLWKKRVNKLHVLALRTIVDDIGAEKGFIISSKGFQKGALEAARYTNITLVTFDELVQQTKEFLDEEILLQYEQRMRLLERRYWAHSKTIRKQYGLRDELGDFVYSVHYILLIAYEAIRDAKVKSYPINLRTFLSEEYGEASAENFQQLNNWMNLNFNKADEKILDAEAQMQKDGNFNPDHAWGGRSIFDFWDRAYKSDEANQED